MSTTHLQHDIECPNCGKEITVDGDGNVVKTIEQRTEESLANMHVQVPAPSPQEVAQARLNRDVKLGKPVVEIPAGTTMPTDNSLSASTVMTLGGWFFCVAILVVVVALRRDKKFH